MVDKRTLKTQDRILRAATHVVLESGIINLTLEAVAKQAEISKGGLLYHFGSKDALVQGMIDYYLQRFQARLDEASRQHGSLLKAYVTVIFAGDELEDRMSSGLLAAVSSNPELLTPLQERYRIWQDQFIQQSGLDEIEVIAIRLVLDGWWASNLFGLAPLSDDQVNRLQTYIENLLEKRS